MKKVLVVGALNNLSKRTINLIEHLEKAGYDVYREEPSEKITGMKYNFVVVDELPPNQPFRSRLKSLR